MKRIIACLLVSVFLFSFAGCKDSKSEAPLGAASSTVAGNGKEATKESKKDKKSKDKSSGNDVDESTSKGADKDDASKKESASEKDDSSKKENSKSSDKKTDSKGSSATDSKKSSDSKGSSTSSTTKGSGLSSGTKSTTKGSGATSAKSDTSTAATTKKTTTTTMAKNDPNDAYRKQLESTYGVKIYYGNELSYKPKGITPTKLTSSTDIEYMLGQMNSVLGNYPSGFFYNFSNKGMPLSFYLVDSVGGEFAGFSDLEITTNIMVTLIYDEWNFPFTMNHELMHCIDKYISVYADYEAYFNEYAAKNPSGFSYGYNASSPYIYTSVSSTTADTAFASAYGTSSVTEDRAEMFKYMMYSGYASVFTSGSRMNEKAKILSSQLKQIFGVSSANWDKHIK